MTTMLTANSRWFLLLFLLIIIVILGDHSVSEQDAAGSVEECREAEKSGESKSFCMTATTITTATTTANANSEEEYDYDDYSGSDSREDGVESENQQWEIERNQSDCQDNHEDCEYWSSIGECDANPNYMRNVCPRSCDNCHSLHDDDDGSDMGVSQVLRDTKLGIEKQDLLDLIQKSRQYMTTDPIAIELGDNGLCHNEHKLCGIWTLMGECSKNQQYMHKACAPMCQTCPYTTIEGRCPVDAEEPNTWSKDDLNKMFERITTTPWPSRTLQLEDKYIPSASCSEMSSTIEPQYNQFYNVTVLSSFPWVIIIDDFISELEALELIELGAKQGYNRSLDVGKDLQKNGEFDEVVSNDRTSTTAWCLDDCYTNETARVVTERISQLVGIDEINSEYLQLLRYEEGQRYGPHHDYIPFEKNRQQGKSSKNFCDAASLLFNGSYWQKNYAHGLLFSCLSLRCSYIDSVFIFE